MVVLGGMASTYGAVFGGGHPHPPEGGPGGLPRLRDGDPRRDPDGHHELPAPGPVRRPDASPAARAGAAAWGSPPRRETTLLEVAGLAKSSAGSRPSPTCTSGAGGSGVRRDRAQRCGKTTLFNTSAGFYPPDEERPLRVRSAGGPRARMPSPPAASPHLQNLQVFFNMTVLGNVMVGCHLRSRTGLVAAACGSVGPREERQWGVGAGGAGLLRPRPPARPPASALPYGVLKRVEVARRSLHGRKLLLMDEPAAASTHGDRRDARALRRIRDAGTAVLLVEHNMDLVMQVSDRVLGPRVRQRARRGTPAQIQSNRRVIDAYLGGKVVMRRLTRRCSWSRGSAVTTAHPRAERRLTGPCARASWSPSSVRTAPARAPAAELSAVQPKSAARCGRRRGHHPPAAAQGRARGICHAPEGRQVFVPLSVEDNLGWAPTRPARPGPARARDRAGVRLFPILKERRNPAGRTLSGGQRRCCRSAVPSWAGLGCCCWTSRQWAWRHCWWRKSFASSRS